MVAPFPDFATAGGIAPTGIANEIFGHYTWIARWSQEITTDTDLDAKKYGQLTYIHCQEFDRLVPATISDELASAIISRFALDGLEWATIADMRTDLGAIKAECASLYGWERNRSGPTMDYATLSVDENSQFIETPITSTKPAAVNTRVQDLRNLFT